MGVNVRLRRAFIVAFSFLVLDWHSAARADERHFTYIYEADVLPAGQAEFEQWITHQNGRDGGDYAAWNFREELEYGITDHLQTALYLNFDSLRFTDADGEDQSDFDFKGVSTEWIYQFLNPSIDAVGLALYGEYTTDGLDHELEGKILISKNIDKVVLAANAIYEAEWEREDRETEREAELQFVAGAAYKFDPQWSAGLELRNKRAYPGGHDLSGSEYSVWSVGPNIHYGAPKWWATFTVLPQVHGNGDGAGGSRQLVHEEELEVRLLVGWLL